MIPRADCPVCGKVLTRRAALWSLKRCNHCDARINHRTFNTGSPALVIVSAIQFVVTVLVSVSLPMIFLFGTWQHFLVGFPTWLLWVLHPAMVWPYFTQYKALGDQPPSCARCGYDLRASPDRCPECGTAAVTRPDA